MGADDVSYGKRPPGAAGKHVTRREVIRHGHHGQLVDFFDVAAIADAAVSMMGNQNDPAVTAMRRQARADAQAYSTDAGVIGYDLLLGAAQDSRAPPAAPRRFAANGLRQ